MPTNQKLWFGRESGVEHLRPLPFLGFNTFPGKINFYLRIFFDLRLNAIFCAARLLFPKFSGRVLDIGCGGQPWRWMLTHCQYVGLEIKDVDEKFGYIKKESIIYYDGQHFPFLNESFNHIICTEVIEHVLDPRGFLNECKRCLKKDGQVFLTVPFSARYHYIPYDFWRFTPSGLEVLFNEVGFKQWKINNLGTDVSAIINKINLLIVKLLFPSRGKFSVRLVKIFLGFLFLPAFLVLTLLGLILIRLKIGSPDDPLGYGVLITK